MSAKVNIVSIEVKDNPSRFTDEVKLEITFECFDNLQDDLEWKLTYVGSADTSQYDQVLDSILVGPIPEGRHKFMFETPAPDPAKIPSSELIGVTVLLLSCAYREQEFITIGYYVSVAYESPEMQEAPPPTPQVDKLIRNILHTEPRVTRFAIKWTDDQPDEVPPPQPHADDDYDKEEQERHNNEEHGVERSPSKTDMRDDTDDSCDIQLTNTSGVDEQAQTLTTLCDVTNSNAKPTPNNDDALVKMPPPHTEMNTSSTDQ